MNISSLNNTIPTGTIYGVVLNDRRTQERLCDEFDQPPYKAPPVAPVLYIKTRNTVVGDGATVLIPQEPGVVRIDATVGAVIGKSATAVRADNALDYVAGYVIVSDITLPHENYYRPVVPLRCRDGFCPISAIVTASAFDPANSSLTVFSEDRQVYKGDFSHRVRDLPKLIQDVTEFMTLSPGDVLMLGLPEGAPIVGKSSEIRIEVDGLGVLCHSIDIESEVAA